MNSIITYPILCFERELIIAVREKDRAEAFTIIDNAYDTWHLEPDLVGDACCEEYILDCLTKAGIEYKQVS